MTARNPLAVTLSVWQAIILREAVDRLFDMRFAWFWLLAEPVMHIGFMAFIRTVIRIRTIGNADALIWIIVGMLAFFLFRRTAMQVMHAADSNKSLFAYRQVKPFDPAIARGVLEAFLMTIISVIILAITALLGHDVFPHDALLVMQAVFGLWLFGMAFGLVSSVLLELVPEMKQVLHILMMPLYLISGAILPISSIPQPYQDYLMLNPIAHGLELVRSGFFPYYHTVPELSMAYLYAWAITGIFLGLLLYRRFERELVMR
jgi:capsular polysaccharide transport system permease protein